MNCTICGQATLPGAMLCRPCKAALKRARYLSVQDLPRASILRPRRNRSSTAKRKGTEAAPAAASFVPAPAPRLPSSSRQLLAGAAAIAVLAAVAYFGQQHMGANATDTGTRSAAREAPVAAAQPAEPPAPVVPVAATPAAPAGVEPAGGAASQTRPAASPPVPARVRPAPAPRQEPTPIVATGAIPDGFDTPPEPPRPAPPPPAPVVRPAPPPDRWQSMTNALSQCAREGGFAGIVCDQRVRLESCEGYWGRVPQCPLPPENPGGQ